MVSALHSMSHDLKLLQEQGGCRAVGVALQVLRDPRPTFMMSGPALVAPPLQSPADLADEVSQQEFNLNAPYTTHMLCVNSGSASFEGPGPSNGLQLQSARLEMYNRNRNTRIRNR